MVNEFKLTVVHFARPNPRHICACAWIYCWIKKLWKIRTGQPGLLAARLPGRRAAGPPGRGPLGRRGLWAVGRWAAVLLLEKPNKSYVDNGFLKLSGGLMTSNRDMRNNKIFNLPTRTGNAQPTPKSCVDTNFLKLSGGHLTGGVTKDAQSFTNQKSLLSYEEMQF